MTNKHYTHYHYLHSDSNPRANVPISLKLSKSPTVKDTKTTLKPKKLLNWK